MEGLTHVVIDSEVKDRAGLKRLFEMLKESRSLKLLHLRQPNYCNSISRYLVKKCFPVIETLSTTEYRFRDCLGRSLTELCESNPSNTGTTSSLTTLYTTDLAEIENIDLE